MTPQLYPCGPCAMVGLPACGPSGCAAPRPVDLVRHHRPPHRPGMPECRRLAAVSSQSQPIGEFLEWLADAGFHLAEYDRRGDRLVPSPLGTNKLLALYFKIDLARVERERRRLLAYLQKKGEL